MYTSDPFLFPVALSLVISSIWFAYILHAYKFIPRINDKYGVLFPSLFLLGSPFLLTYLFTYFEQQLIESFKIILPIFTFILGQSVSKLEKKQENKKKLKKMVRVLVQFMEIELIEGLSTLEQKIGQYISKGGDSKSNDIDNYRRKLLKKIEQEYQSLVNKEELLENDVSMVSTLYLKKVQNFLDNFSVEDISTEDISTFNLTIPEIVRLKLEGYSFVSALIKDFLMADKLRVNTWFSFLENERITLKRKLDRVSFQEGKNENSYQKSFADLPDISILKYSEKYIDRLLQSLPVKRNFP